MPSTDSISTESVLPESVDHIATEAVEFIKSKNIVNPVEMLRYLQRVIVSGRPLEVEYPTVYVEGVTNYIFVNRNQLLQRAFDEIIYLEDLRPTLEVDFYNEVKHNFRQIKKREFI